MKYMNIYLLITVIIIFTMTGCSNTNNEVKNDNNKESIYNSQMEMDIDISEYNKAFENYLNAYANGEKYTSELIAADLIVNIPDDSAEDEEVPPPTDEVESEYADNEQTEFPIVDPYGNIIGYGTKEESDNSYKIYEETPYYTVESGSFFYDMILFRVYNKGELSTKTYLCALDSTFKIVSFEILDTLG